MAPKKLPLELQVGLRSGSVFYFQARELSSAQPHFFVVINRHVNFRNLTLSSSPFLAL